MSARSALKSKQILQFDLKSLFGLIFGFAILFTIKDYFSLSSVITIGVMVAALALLESKSRIVLGTLIAVMLIPNIWLLLIDYQMNSYWWKWISMWPTLPGLLPSRLVFDDLPDRTLEFVSGGITLAVLATGVLVGRFNRMTFILTTLFFAVASIASAAILYQLFLV